MRLLTICLTIILLNSASFAITGKDLVQNARLYEDKNIEFQGEVIGDIMARGGHVWLNINDGTRAIGVWAKKSLIKDVKISGDYNNLGDKIKVIGVFNRACPEHGGDLDIHAKKISLIEKGRKVNHPIAPWKFPLAGILFAITLGVQLFFIIKKRLEPKI